MNRGRVYKRLSRKLEVKYDALQAESKVQRYENDELQAWFFGKKRKPSTGHPEPEPHRTGEVRPRQAMTRSVVPSRLRRSRARSGWVLSLVSLSGSPASGTGWLAKA
jgi:hypothetical protein